MKAELDKILATNKGYKNPWEHFEECKKVLALYNLTPEEYEKNIKHISKELGI